MALKLSAVELETPFASCVLIEVPVDDGAAPAKLVPDVPNPMFSVAVACWPATPEAVKPSAVLPVLARYCVTATEELLPVLAEVKVSAPVVALVPAVTVPARNVLPVI